MGAIPKTPGEKDEFRAFIKKQQRESIPAGEENFLQAVENSFKIF